MIEKSNPMKGIVSEFLAFLKYKFDNDILTMEEIASILKTIESGMVVTGTAQDFADFYGQSVTNVRSVIKRTMPETHKRRTVYPFGKFQKRVPKKWHETAYDTTK